MAKDQEFEKHLSEISDPKNNSEVNYSLPKNPTPLQVAERIGISKVETEDILLLQQNRKTLTYMPKSFKLIEEKFSEVDRERQLTCELKITFKSVSGGTYNLNFPS